MTDGNALPFGLRDVRLTPYTDGGSTILGTPVDLPVSRTLSFTESEEYESLRGDDQEVATHGSGPIVEWELESGGISFAAWKVLTGGRVDEVSPGRWRFRKKVTDQRPYFKIEGQSISDSGGDLHCIIYRAKCNDSLEGEFSDQSFMLTNCSGVGYGALTGDPNDDNTEYGTVYDFFQNDVVTSIPQAPDGPFNLTAPASAATTVTLAWNALPAGTTFKIYRKLAADPDIAFVAGTPATAASLATGVTQTGLVASTNYEFKVTPVRDGIEGNGSRVTKSTTA